MNFRRSAFAPAVSAGAVLACGAAQAGRGGAGATTRPMKAIDTDHDGTIDLKEARTAASAHLGHLDKDLDNTLAKKAMSHLGLDRNAYARADPDKDNTIGESEYLALVERQFKAADPDNDGTLSSGETRTKAGGTPMRMIAK